MTYSVYYLLSMGSLSTLVDLMESESGIWKKRDLVKRLSLLQDFTCSTKISAGKKT